MVQYLNDHHLAKINVDLGVFRPKAPPHRLIAPFTQDDITAILDVISSSSKTPKRDAAIILLAFNTGLRCSDIRNLQLHNIDWEKQELRIVQQKTGLSILAPLNGKTLNAIAAYILNERPQSEDMAGMPLELVSQWLGHSKMETSLIYARATTEMKRKAIDKISSAENSVFSRDEKFKYADNETVIRQLYGLM